MAEVLIELDAFTLTILIDKLPHVMLNRTALLGVESWLMTKETLAPRYYLAFFMKDGVVIECDYDRRDIWEDILRELSSKKLFHPVV